MCRTQSRVHQAARWILCRTTWPTVCASFSWGSIRVCYPCARVTIYFSSRTNRFWRATNGTGMFDPALEAKTDHLALEQGIGFTDLVKRPTANASELRAGDYRTGAAALRKRLNGCSPLIVCFNGITAYRHYLKYGEKQDRGCWPGFKKRDGRTRISSWRPARVRRTRASAWMN